MKIMKLIDILVKIANDEEVPKKIKYQDSIFTYNKEEKDYETWFDDKCGLSLFNLVYITPLLNEEVEIIEDTPKEDKKIEKIDISNFPKRNNSLKKTALKVNEIIDSLNSEK